MGNLPPMTGDKPGKLGLILDVVPGDKSGHQRGSFGFQMGGPRPIS